MNDPGSHEGLSLAPLLRSGLAVSPLRLPFRGQNDEGKISQVTEMLGMCVSVR